MPNNFAAPALTERERNDRLKLTARARELFKEGCYQGDLARTPIEDLDENEVTVLEAISETAFALGHTFETDHG